MNVTIYAANAGDRNERAMRGAVSLGMAIARRIGVEPLAIGAPTALVEGGWAEQLKAAAPNLRLLARQVARHLESDDRTILTMSRCAAGIATLPLIAARFPDAAILWFDAHGDCNIPLEGGVADNSYLGGMVISGAAGEWDTGFGGGVDLANVILVGARDLDPPEQERIEAGQIALVPVGPLLGRRLVDAIGGRPVYVHLDCDVLSAGLIATEYQSPAGLSFEDLREAFGALAGLDVVGLEIAEYEACWPDGQPSCADRLLDAIQPVLAALGSS